eukprot:CAMPEP_0181294180 /NCGR_PEP_ID=MMETSP1101-20121128/3458_1 /TAXON_ID=46948 /ORGANISM="Rhodomonas abbreviata, Strain Caron Lab Isolate" /LENGTH=141 /DNA_ID=CAMNT_0023398811 /DNA_START=305 /DNA_END=727 /DNA_ORIENTATION=+
MRSTLERDGMLPPNSHHQTPARAEKGSNAVDIRPEIAAAFAWTRFVPPTNSSPATPSSRSLSGSSPFELKRGENGAMLVVPKKKQPQMGRAEIDNFLVTEMYKHPEKTVSQLKQDHPHIFTPQASAHSFPGWLQEEEWKRR